MTVNELISALELKTFFLEDGDRDIDGAYCGDLLSWVMGKAPADAAWVTIMSNQNVAAVAALSDAACVILAGSGLDLKLSRDARSAGYAFIPADGQAGGSEITALMQEKKIDQAQALIVLAKEKVQEEILAPVSSDPDYLTQLEADKDELNLLDAVCLLRKGKYFKAKKALKAIASANGAFAEEARTLLKEL